jgi:hypothetical protein
MSRAPSFRVVTSVAAVVGAIALAGCANHADEEAADAPDAAVSDGEPLPYLHAADTPAEVATFMRTINATLIRNERASRRMGGDRVRRPRL